MDTTTSGPEIHPSSLRDVPVNHGSYQAYEDHAKLSTRAHSFNSIT